MTLDAKDIIVTIAETTLHGYIRTSQDVQDIKADKAIEELIASEYVEPGQEPETTEGSNGTVTTTGSSRNTMAIYLICFAAILALTVAIILVMSRKTPAKGKKK